MILSLYSFGIPAGSKQHLLPWRWNIVHDISNISLCMDFAHFYALKFSSSMIPLFPMGFEEAMFVDLQQWSAVLPWKKNKAVDLFFLSFN